MARDRKRPDPDLVQQMSEAVAAAKEEILNKSTLDALMNSKPEDLIAPDSEAEVVKGNAKRPGCWLISPAMLDLFAAADKRLTRVAELTGSKVKRVEKVHAWLISGTRVLLLKPAPAEDLTAIPVVRYHHAVTINLFPLLGEHGMTVPTGYRERYDVAYVPEGSPHYPGLVINLDDPKERRTLSSARKSSESGEQQP